MRHQVGLIGSAIDYTTKALGYVNKDAAKVGEFGKSVFGLIKSGTSGDFGGVFDGGLELLKLIGVIEEQGGSEGVTNEDLQKDIKDLHKLTEGMSARLDDGVKQVYQNRLVSFDNAIGALAIDRGQAERMFKKADALAKERDLLDLPKSDVPPVPEMPSLPEMPAELAQDVVLPDEPAVREISFANHIASPYDVKNLLLSDARNYLRHTNAQGESVPFTDEEVAEIVAMCDQAIAEHEQVKADWQAECDRLVIERERARSDWRWNATLQQNEEFRKLYEEWMAETDECPQRVPGPP